MTGSPLQHGYLDNHDKIHAYTLRTFWMLQPETQSTGEIGMLIYFPYLKYKCHITVTLHKLWLHNCSPHYRNILFNSNSVWCHNPLITVCQGFKQVWIDIKSISLSNWPNYCWNRDIPGKLNQYRGCGCPRAWASYQIQKSGLRIRRRCRERFPPPPTSKETAS